MNEHWDEFDCSLATSLSEEPPSEKVIQATTPFRDAVSKIVAGLFLTTINFRLLYLQYILPLLGTILLYLGFRSLRNNSRWFRLAQWLSALLFLAMSCLDIWSAAPCWEDAAYSHLIILYRCLNIAAMVGLYICFYLGFAQAAREAGQPPAGKPALAAAVWQVVTTLIALLFPDGGWLVALPLVIAFVCILRALLRASKEVESCGYAVRAAPVYVSGGRLIAAGLSLTAAAVLACAAWANHPGMAASPLPETAEPAAIAERLTGLGFPEELLSRLPEDEIRRLETAMACSSSTSEPIGSKFGRSAARFDTVYVQLEQTTVRVYEFFTLRKDTLRSNWRTETALDFSPLIATSDITGGVTWRDKSGRPLWSGMDIGGQTCEDFFTGASTLPAAVFAYPFGSHKRGGYMAYTARNAKADEEYIGFGSVLRLYFTTSWNFYPYKENLINSRDWYTQSYSYCDFGPTFQPAS